jgi:hypothetical protein
VRFYSLVFPVFSCETRHSDFLEKLDERSFFTPPTTVTPSLMSSASFPSSNPAPAPTSTPSVAGSIDNPSQTETNLPAPPIMQSLLPSATKAERFLLIAADQTSGTRDERLQRVIDSKYEAGLLKPYDYRNGYARLSKWMDSKLVFILFYFQAMMRR